jgi:DNA-binding response OmpR family regulator
VVDHADNGLNGYHLAMTAEYDLLILDIMLPDVNGWDIVRMLRSAEKDAHPVTHGSARLNTGLKGLSWARMTI